MSYGVKCIDRWEVNDRNLSTKQCRFCSKKLLLNSPVFYISDIRGDNSLNALYYHTSCFISWIKLQQREAIRISVRNRNLDSNKPDKNIELYIPD